MTALRSAEPRVGGWMLTYTSKAFWPLDARESEVCIEDIAHALSQQCRFAGHTRYPYSVAQHSVLVSLETRPEHALAGLLHDATEAYLVDVPTPVKAFMPEYRAWEARLHAVIARRFGVPEELPLDVKRADAVLLATEARDLMPASPREWLLYEKPRAQTIAWWGPGTAERAFLERFEELTEGRR
jgi:hypothetical protein